MTILSGYTTSQQPVSSPEWSVLAANPRVEAGFAPRNSSIEVPGVSLVHLVDKCSATAGDRLLFTAWILNATAETLTDVTLVLRSLSNARLEQLQFATQPADKLLKSRVLGPRQSLQYSFSYQMTTVDAAESGLLISALGAELTSSTRGRLHSECDASVATKL